MNGQYHGQEDFIQNYQIGKANMFYKSEFYKNINKTRKQKKNTLKKLFYMFLSSFKEIYIKKMNLTKKTVCKSTNCYINV